METANQTVDQQELFGEEIAPESHSAGALTPDPAFLDETTEQPESAAPATPDITAEQALPEWADPTKPDLDVESAARHWKKRHGDSQRYISKLKEQYGGMTPEHVQNLTALQRVISRDRNLMDQVYAAIEGRPTAAGTWSSDHNPEPEPERIEPPEDFNPADIYDPATPSGKWHLEQEGRRMQNLEKRILQGVTSLIGEERKQTLAAQQKSARQQEFAQFIAKNGLTQEEQVDFQEFVTKGPGRQVTLDDMFKFYRLLRDEELPRPAVDIAGHIEKAKQAVVPPTVNPGIARNPAAQPEDEFGASLLTAQRRNRIVVNK